MSRVARGMRMWFGTRNLMQWVACPNAEIPMSKNGWSTGSNYLNGGAYVRRSTAAHKEYQLTWDPITRPEILPILDYADRLYGNGPFYWVDPWTRDLNMLPQWAASPFQVLDDAPPCYVDGAVIESVQTPANTLGYPVTSVRYTLDASSVARNSPWIPIPPDHTAWIGVHGFDASGGANVQIIPTTGPTTYGTPVAATILPVTSTARVTDSVPAASGATGIVLALEAVDGSSITLSGIIVQVLPDGQTPEAGGFVSGQGHSGCEFAQQPEYVPYSAAFGNGSVIAEMVETEGWR